MGLHQEFRFKHGSPDDVRVFMRQFSGTAVVNDRYDFFVFSQLPGTPEFTFDCELIESGVRSERGGEYFHFLGVFLESLTGTFGAVEVEDI